MRRSAFHDRHDLAVDVDFEADLIAGPGRDTALLEALEAAENHLLGLGFDARRLDGAAGFDRIEALRDAVDALCT
jgi:hypothetical protein